MKKERNKAMKNKQKKYVKLRKKLTDQQNYSILL